MAVVALVSKVAVILLDTAYPQTSLSKPRVLNTLAQKRLTFSIMVGLYEPQKVKGCLLSYYLSTN